MPRVACRGDCSDWLNLELFRTDWSNLEPLAPISTVRGRVDVRVERVVVACRADGSDWTNLELAPPSNVPGSHFREMAFVAVTPDHIDVALHAAFRTARCMPGNRLCVCFCFYSTVVIRISSPLHSFYFYFFLFFIIIYFSLLYLFYYI